MEELISKLGNIAYRYDEGERPDFDAYIESFRLSGFPKTISIRVFTKLLPLRSDLLMKFMMKSE